MSKYFLLLSIALLSACNANRLSYFPSYKITIDQGNQLDSQVIAQLSPAMTKNQVMSLLGSPMLQDPFHSNRWDYPMMVIRNGVIQEQKMLSVTFENDVLVDISGDALTDELRQSFSGER